MKNTLRHHHSISRKNAVRIRAKADFEYGFFYITTQYKEFIMKTQKTLILGIFSLMLTLALAACPTDDSTGGAPTEPVIDGISIEDGNLEFGAINPKWTQDDVNIRVRMAMKFLAEQARDIERQYKEWRDELAPTQNSFNYIHISDRMKFADTIRGYENTISSALSSSRAMDSVKGSVSGAIFHRDGQNVISGIRVSLPAMSADYFDDYSETQMRARLEIFQLVNYMHTRKHASAEEQAENQTELERLAYLYYGRGYLSLLPTDNIEATMQQLKADLQYTMQSSNPRAGPPARNGVFIQQFEDYAQFDAWTEDLKTLGYDYVNQWVPTVTFNANGGNGTVPNARTVNTGSRITIPSGDGLTRSGYLFDGWNTNPSGTGTTYQSGDSFTPSGTITLYARWVTTYTITFDLNGGKGTVPQRTVELGYSVVLPGSENISGVYVTFTGWNTNADGSGTNYTSSYTPTGNIVRITLYAQWDAVPLSSVTGLANKLAWLQVHAQSNMNYTFYGGTETIAPQTLSYSNRSGITITLKDGDISLTSNGAMFTVDSSVTLVLDNNITLQGRSNNTAPLVRVNADGTLVMNAGSRITGNSNNTTQPYYGGGVSVGGTFTMHGGEISGNTASYGGGGVYVGGTFTMHDGEISDNTASNYGGGVFVRDGTFTMNGGEIRSNTAGNGGGVSMEYGTFTMSNGTISGNRASSGVLVNLSGTFRIVTGTIYGSNEGDLSNGAALSLSNGVTAQRGTFSGETWTSKGSLPNTTNTIRVVNGELQ